MIETGKIQSLKVADEDGSGYYLVCEDNQEVFMPGSLAQGKSIVGEMLEVYIFLDKDGNQLATPNLPKYELGDFALLKVKSETKFGAFLDMGTPRDLFVPKKFQQFEMKEGEFHLVKILLEEDSGRLYGSSKLKPFLKPVSSLNVGQTVKIQPYYRTSMGYKVLIEDKYPGIIYHNEIFSEVELGEEYTGSIKTLRDNGEIDALMQEVGFRQVELNSQEILRRLKLANGKLKLWDKSSPEEIKDSMGMSKGAFKKAIGFLYKKNQIDLGQRCIELKNFRT